VGTCPRKAEGWNSGELKSDTVIRLIRMVDEAVRQIVRRALEEDIGGGDVTSEATIAADLVLTGFFKAKEAGVIAGLAVAREVFALLDERVVMTAEVEDGDEVEAGKVLGTVSGPGRAILSGERTALNLLQRMSGIATLTRRYVAAVGGTKAVILDTRKTAPGLRLLDKWAVQLGGGQNHRFGLYDMVLIKDNHIAAVGGITAAVERVRAADGQGRPVEVGQYVGGDDAAGGGVGETPGERPGAAGSVRQCVAGECGGGGGNRGGFYFGRGVDPFGEGVGY
jgi:nicotinate-nucleotide pyrophosphorylase